MSQFITFINNHHNIYYIYENYNYRKFIIPSKLLCFLFKTYGYFIDPGTIDQTLDSKQVQKLEEMAYSTNDEPLLKVINSLRLQRPVKTCEYNLYSITVNERKKYQSYTIYQRNSILSTANKLMEIGLYIIGWNGKEPYPLSQKPVCDIIRAQIIINPVIKRLLNSQWYLLIKDFPIVRYNNSMYPKILDCKLTIESLIARIQKQDSNTACKDIALDLISTCYYFITMVCNVPSPMIESLIKSFYS